MFVDLSLKLRAVAEAEEGEIRPNEWKRGKKRGRAGRERGGARLGGRASLMLILGVE